MQKVAKRRALIAVAMIVIGTVIIILAKFSPQRHPNESCGEIHCISLLLKGYCAVLRRGSLL